MLASLLSQGYWIRNSLIQKYNSPTNLTKLYINSGSVLSSNSATFFQMHIWLAANLWNSMCWVVILENCNLNILKQWYSLSHYCWLTTDDGTQKEWIAKCLCVPSSGWHLLCSLVFCWALLFSSSCFSPQY